MSARDDRGKRIDGRGASRRIVSLVPSITETLFHLGAGSRVVGATRFCTDPPEAASVTKMGGTKDPDCARIIATHPDVVFVSEEENRREDFDELEAAGLEVFVSFPKRMEEVAGWVERVGAAVGCEVAAAALAQAIGVAVDAMKRTVDHSVPMPSVFCPIWRNPWMSFNHDTYADAILRLCGAANVCAAEPERYFRISLEEIAPREPELILLPDEPYPFQKKHLPDLHMLLSPNGPVERVSFVDGRALTWYGSRTPAALQIIRAAISEDRA